MGFKCGIVGLPNVGKSTLFNALTKAGIDSANYPFCTIEPNIGIVPVNDSRLQSLANIVSPEKILPTTMEFVDIAGLVEGASKGDVTCLLSGETGDYGQSIADLNIHSALCCGIFVDEELVAYLYLDAREQEQQIQFRKRYNTVHSNKNKNLYPQNEFYEP